MAGIWTMQLRCMYCYSSSPHTPIYYQYTCIYLFSRYILICYWPALHAWIFMIYSKRYTCCRYPLICMVYSDGPMNLAVQHRGTPSVWDIKGLLIIIISCTVLYVMQSTACTCPMIVSNYMSMGAWPLQPWYYNLVLRHCMVTLFTVHCYGCNPHARKWVHDHTDTNCFKLLMTMFKYIVFNRPLQW